VSKFEVLIQSFEDLSENEKLGASNNGSGKEYAAYLRVRELGDTVYLESDAMEPEDARFSRDLSWIKDALEYAYKCGFTDGRDV
jgi:hypothetical protein